MEGKIFSYVHFNGKIGSLVKLSTITDFAARTDEFDNLGKYVAMQVAATNPPTIYDLLKQEFIMDSQQTIQMLVDKTAKVLDEEINIVAHQRYSFNENI